MTQASTSDRLQGPQVGALAVGVLALAGCAASAWWNATRVFEAYLLAYFFWLGLPLGSLALVMLHQLVGGRWGRPGRWLLEAAVGTLPIMAALFLPLLLGTRRLYPWAHHDALEDPLILHKSGYLNVPFFTARSLLYLVIWVVLGWLLVRWSRAGGPHAEPTRPARARRLAGVGAVLYVLTVSFAAIDWTMSLDPHWHSTIYGMIVIVSQVLTALAVLILSLWALMALRASGRVVWVEQLADLGTLLLAFVVLWAYLSFSQYLVTWSGNLPEEAAWYRMRSGGWAVVAGALMLVHFGLPFALLLSRQVKRRADWLAGVAGLVLVMHLVSVYWFVVPSMESPRPLNWRQPLATVGLGGIWLGLYLGQVRRRAIPLLAAAPQPEARA